MRCICQIRCACCRYPMRRLVRDAYEMQRSAPPQARLPAGLPAVLPAGMAYPPFKDYPAGAAQQRMAERQAIQDAEDALLRRQKVCARARAIRQELFPGVHLSCSLPEQFGSGDVCKLVD